VLAWRLVIGFAVRRVRESRRLPDQPSELCDRANGQAGAGTEREVRFFLARRDLQRFIGDFEGQDIFFNQVQSHRGVAHGI
jgi:hypothetical protein